MLHDADDVRGVATAGALGVVRVDGAPLEGGEGALDEPRLVERVRVDQALHVQLVADGQARVDGRGRGAPVLVELEPAGPRDYLLAQGLGVAVVAFARDADVDGQRVARLEHLAHVIGAGCAGRRTRTGAVMNCERVEVGEGVGVREGRFSDTYLGPVPPPSMVVMPEAMASWICCGHMK